MNQWVNKADYIPLNIVSKLLVSKLLKTSRYIQYPDACKLLDHAKLACQSGIPWNCFMTIDMEQGGVDPKLASLHLRQSLQRLKKYHERKGMIYSCGWVLENGPVKGVHAHITLHRPTIMPMHPISYWWASLRCFQITRSKGILQCRKFYSWQSYEHNLSEISDYMLKGIRPDVASLFKINPSNEGLIYGKRIGWSRG